MNSLVVGLGVGSVAALLFGLGWRRRRKRLEGLLGPRVDAWLPRRTRTSTTALMLASAAAWGLAGGVGHAWWIQPPPRPAGRVAYECVICLDVSRSMLARDVVPSRLERAQQEIARWAAGPAGGAARAGLVAFAGSATRIVPLTTDLASLAWMAKDLGPTTVERGGTDLAAAIAKARETLGPAGGIPRAIVLLTDGEAPDALAERAAAVARADGIAVHALGVATAHGGKIPLDDGNGEAWLLDEAGREATSRLDESGLVGIAARGGGRFVAVESSGGPRGLADLLDPGSSGQGTHLAAAVAGRPPARGASWALLGAAASWLLLGLGVSGRRR